MYARRLADSSLADEGKLAPMFWVIHEASMGADAFSIMPCWTSGCHKASSSEKDC